LAGGLGLRERGGRLHTADYLGGPVALVVADAQDVDVGPRRRSVDLERDGLPGEHAHRRGEALDRCISLTAYLPVAGRVTRLCVLAGDHAGHRRAAWTGRRDWLGADHGEQTEQQHCEYKSDD